MRIFLLLFFIVIQTWTTLYGQDCKTLECYQKKVYKELKYYRVFPVGGSLIHGSHQWYSERSRKRLLDLLKNNNWQKWEIDSLVKSYLGDTSRFKRYARNISKRKDMTYQYALDSIMANYKDELKERLSNKKVSKHIVLTAGWLDDKRYIPVLKEALNKPEQYNQNIVKIALARFQIEPYYSQILNNNRIDIDKDKRRGVLDRKYGILTYLCTQESIYEASKTLFIKRKYQYFSAPDSEPIPYNYEAFGIANFVDNLPYPFKKEDGSTWYYSKKKKMWISPTPFMPSIFGDKKDIIKLGEWFRENKGNYVLDREFTTNTGNLWGM